MDVCHVCEAAGDEIADDMDALEVCEDIDIMEGVNGERLDKFVKNFDKPFRPKDCNQSLYGIKKGCGDSKTQWYSHKKDRELREQSHRGPGIEGYLKREDMNESESLLASLEDEAYEKKEWLREVCEDNGLKCLFFPKYHCELNYIEVVWAYIRHRLRRDCDFNYEGMRRRLVELLDGGVPLEVFKRNSRFCFRFMDGYRRGLEGPLLDWANKRYSGKRCLPLSLTNEELTMKHEEFKRIKEEKKSKIARLKKK